MESRKMVLMNLFAGLQWRCKCKEWNCGEGEGESGTNGDSNMETNTL